MTAEHNLELHRQVISAAAAGTVPESLLAPDFRMDQHVCSMTDRTYLGADGWRDWKDDLFEEFCRDAKLEVEAILTAEHDVVVAALSLAGTNIHTGTPIEFRWSEVTWFKDGRATRTIGFTTRRRALEFAKLGDHEIRHDALDVPSGPSRHPGDDGPRAEDPTGEGPAPHPCHSRRRPRPRFAGAALSGAALRLARVAGSWLPAQSTGA